MSTSSRCSVVKEGGSTVSSPASSPGEGAKTARAGSRRCGLNSSDRDSIQGRELGIAEKGIIVQAAEIHQSFEVVGTGLDDLKASRTSPRRVLSRGSGFSFSTSLESLRRASSS